MSVHSLLLSLLAAAIAAAGQLLLRAAMLRVGPLDLKVASIHRLLSQPLLWAAAPVYATGLFVWLMVLSRVPLSIAYPMLGMTYVFVPLVSALILDERLLGQHWLGVVLVCAGVVVIGIAPR